MTLLMILGLMGYLIFRLNTIYQTREYDYRWREITYTQDQMNNLNVTLGKYNNSLNFFFGLAEYSQDFDILNNPYVEYHALERTGGRTFYPKYDYEHCTVEYLSLFLKEN